MKITAELSLYPIAAGASPDALRNIVRFIDDLARDSRVEVVVNQMSTQLRGELDDVMNAIAGAMRQSFAAGHTQALVAKFLSADLPIGEAPDLDPHR